MLRIKLNTQRPKADGAAMRLLGAVDRMSFVNPFDDREWVMEVGVKVEARAVTDNLVRISGLAALAPRHGTGTLGLLQLTGLADVYGVSLELGAVPYGESENTLSQNALRAWYIDRGGFSPRRYDDGDEDDAEMVRDPQTRSARAGMFYGLAEPKTDAMDDSFLSALGIETLRSADGRFIFRGDAGAVEQLMLHCADFRLHDLSHRPDDVMNVPVADLSYAQRMAEISCMRWHCQSAGPEIPIDTANQRLEQLLAAPKAHRNTILRNARAAKPTGGPTPD